MTFELLAQNIESVQSALQQQAAHAVNLSLTARNWLVGWYIVEYEQNGEDRAQYGEALLKNLAKRIHTRCLGERRLYEFRLMYNAYPQLGEQVMPFVLKFSQKGILRLPTAISFSDYGKTTVQYVTEGLADSVFVSKYRLQLPTEQDIEKYLELNK
ncbi:MAG: hypothetical protein IJ776_08215 [Paludibacteraceae bacterium]|nr:hypothetical protein [Paludibacteraceae bacterium]